jgi:hypothetical protein
MTRDQIKLLRALGAFVAFKVLLYASIHYAAKTARETNARYQSAPKLNGQIILSDLTDEVQGHVKLQDGD